MDLRLLTFALSMFLAFELGEGIKCHVCNGEKGCDDPYLEHNGQTITKDEKLVECPATDDMCRKIYQNVRDEVKIFRSCASERYARIGEDPQQNTCYKTVMEEYNTYVCTCAPGTKDAEGNDILDGCNGADTNKVSGLIMTLIPLITLGVLRQ